MTGIFFCTVKLLRKDLIIEARRAELTAISLMSVIGLSIILSYGVWLAGISQSQKIELAPALSLSVLFIAALSVISKFSEYDEKSGALDGLLVANVSSDALYLARVAAIFLLTFIAAFASGLVLPALLGLTPSLLLSWNGALVFCGVSLGLASLGATLAPIAVRARAGAIFLLTLMLPLAIPLFFASCEVLSGNPSTRDFWWTLLAALDAVYLAAGLWLHPHVVR